jgi:hypothetical protein
MTTYNNHDHGVTTVIVLGDGSISLTIHGEGISIPVDHPNRQTIYNAVVDRKLHLIPDLIDIGKVIEDQASGRVSVKDGVVYFNDRPMHNSLTDRLLDQLAEGETCEPMMAYLDNLGDNPSTRAVGELYAFQQANDLPITEDGHGMGYKIINKDWTDCYTGTISNHIGAVVSMDRKAVNSNSEQTCSTGLHVCSQGYLDSFFASSSKRVVLVKFNPRDVVSIPTDYDNSKMRVCRYQVVKELVNNRTGDALKTTVYRDESILSYEGAMFYFDITASALRKRLNRGVSCVRVQVDGEPMVKLLD